MKKNISIEIFLATGLCFAWVIALYQISLLEGAISQIGILGIPLVFVYLPLIVCRIKKAPPSEIGFTFSNIKEDLFLTLKVAAVIMPLFIIGHYLIFKLFFGTPFTLFINREIVIIALWNLIGVSFPEEVFFRGYLQERVSKICGKKIKLPGTDIGVAVVITSALFALAHLIKGLDVGYLAVFFPSLLFGWIRERTKTIVAPWLMHWLANMTLLFLQGNI